MCGDIRTENVGWRERGYLRRRCREVDRSRAARWVCEAPAEVASLTGKRAEQDKLKS